MGYSKKLYNILGGLQVCIIADSYNLSIPRLNKYHKVFLVFLLLFHKKFGIIPQRLCLEPCNFPTVPTFSRFFDIRIGRTERKHNTLPSNENGLLYSGRIRGGRGGGKCVPAWKYRSFPHSPQVFPQPPVSRLWISVLCISVYIIMFLQFVTS